jgi:tetratricopeptide (TPR) repeat protein
MWSNARHPSVLLQRLVESSRPIASKARLVPSILDYAYRATIKTVVFAIGIVLLVATVRAIVGSQIVIEPISVPRQLEEDGYSGAVVARRLLGQLQLIGRSGNDLYVTQSTNVPQERVRFRSEDDFSSLTTVHVPSSGLSLRSMAQALREFLGFPESKISGEITIKRPTDAKAPAAYTIVLRFSSSAAPTAEPVEADSIDEVIRLSAPLIAEQFDPVGLAAYYLQNKNWTEMNRLADSLVADVDPEFRKEGLLLRGAHAFLNQKSDEAIEFFRQAIKEDPRFGEAYNGWGAALASLGDYDNAIEKYQQAIELNPFNYTAYFNRGVAYRAKGESDRAMKDFERAIKLSPKNAAAFVDRGVAFLDK